MADHRQERFDLHALGRVIHVARSRQGASLERLAATSGVSAGLISQLERGKGNPSFNTLRRLAAALEIPLATFMGDESGLPRPAAHDHDVLRAPGAGRRTHIVRTAHRKQLHLPQEGLTYELLTPDLQGALEVLRTTLPPGFDNADRPFEHRGEECVHLLVGRLELHIGGQTYEMTSGDSATYDAAVPHWWANAGGGEATIIGVVTPPSF